MCVCVVLHVNMQYDKMQNTRVAHTNTQHTEHILPHCVIGVVRIETQHLAVLFAPLHEVEFCQTDGRCGKNEKSHKRIVCM